MYVDVEVLPGGLEHWRLGLGLLQAQRSDLPSVLANSQGPGVFGWGSLRSRSLLSGSLGPAPVAPISLGTGLGGGAWLNLGPGAKGVREKRLHMAGLALCLCRDRILP